MKKNKVKKIVLIAALATALQPATSQCFSWSLSNLFAGCQSKVSGLLAAAQENRTKSALIVGGTSIVALALDTCLYKWFFGKKNKKEEVKKNESAVLEKNNDGDGNQEIDTEVANLVGIPLPPSETEFNNWESKPTTSTNNIEVDKQEAPQKKVIPTKNQNNGMGVNNELQEKIKKQAQKNPLIEKQNPELEKKLKEIEEAKKLEQEQKKTTITKPTQPKKTNNPPSSKPLDLGFGNIINQETVKKLKKTGRDSTKELSNKPEYEIKKTDFKKVFLKKPLVNPDFVPESQLGDSSTSELIETNNPIVSTNNTETPK